MALLNVNLLKSLVAIGQLNKRQKFTCSATGFLIGFIANTSNDPKKRTYYIFLITNRHVFENHKFIYLRLNNKNGKTKTYRQELFFPNNESKWLNHQNNKVDLALLNINPNILKNHDIDFLPFTEEIFAYWKDFNKLGIEIGDEVFIVGFPMNIVGKIQNYPCVKLGVISRIDKELINENKSFLIDSSIFPGNSGSPVLLKPMIHSLTGTKAVSQTYLLGIISQYLPYQEELYSHQTTPFSVVSLERENSGLTFVVPMDYARQIFKRWIREKKQLLKVQKQTSEIRMNINKTTGSKTKI